MSRNSIFVANVSGLYEQVCGNCVVQENAEHCDFPNIWKLFFFFFTDSWTNRTSQMLKFNKNIVINEEHMLILNLSYISNMVLIAKTGACLSLCYITTSFNNTQMLWNWCQTYIYHPALSCPHWYVSSTSLIALSYHHACWLLNCPPIAGVF